MRYVVYLIDHETGAMSPIDNIDEVCGYTAADYVRACMGNADSDWCEMLNENEVVLEVEGDFPNPSCRLSDFKNYDEFKKELKEMLMHFVIDNCPCQQDIYLYVDREKNEIRIEEFRIEKFENPSGIHLYSWKPDPNYSFRDFFDCVKTIADSVGMEESELLEASKDYDDYPFWCNPSDWDKAFDFCENNPELFEKMVAYRAEYIASNYSDYYSDLADDIIDNFKFE